MQARKQIGSYSLFFVTSILIAAILMLLGLSACTQDASETNAESKIVTDAYGREVEVPSDVQSIATVGSGARFVVYAGGQDKLIAVTDMETEPSTTRPYSVAYSDLFADLPSTSNGNHALDTNVNSELLLELDPDVIISSRSSEECDELQAAIGIPVIGIYYDTSIFDENVYNSLTAVGQAIGTEEHVQEVIAKMQEWEADLKTRTENISDEDKPTCYFGAINYRGAKSFSGTYANYEPAEVVNAINVADETGQSGSIDIDLEQLGVWDPDYIFLNTANLSLMAADYQSSQGFFDSLSAFKNGNLYSQPAVIFNGTNVEMGICNAYFIGSTIYPDAFADLDIQQVYSDIFSTMLGVDYYPTLQSQGLDFVKLDISVFSEQTTD